MTQVSPLSTLYWYQNIASELPGMSKNHQPRSGSDVYNDIRLLGALLGKVISTPRGDTSIEGPNLFLLIENLRRAAKKKHHNAHKARDRQHLIEQTLQEGLSNFSTEQHAECIRKTVGGFRLFLELAAMVENYHGKHQHGLNVGFINEWAQQHNVSSQDAKNLLKDLDLRFVSTAHPTQVYRETYLRHEQDILELLSHFHSADTEHQQHRSVQSIEARIETLWLTRFERWDRPTVQDEAQGLMPYLSVMVETLPSLLHQISSPDSSEKPNLQLGSWIGGDMDGNPYTNAQTLSHILTERRHWLIGYYEQAIVEMSHKLSYSHHTTFHLSDEFTTQLAQRYQHFLESSYTHEEQYEKHIRHFQQREPIRQWLLLIGASLAQSKENSSNTAGFSYESPTQLLTDLETALAELTTNRVNPISLEPLERLRTQIKLFGFHLVGIDLREEASVIQETITQWVKGDAPAADNDKQRRDWLLNQLDIITKNPQPPTCHITDEHVPSHRLIQMLQLVAEVQQKSSAPVGQHLLLSMTHHDHDILAAKLLCHWCGLNQPNQPAVKLVPLFETITDLKNAPTIMANLFKESMYQRHLIKQQTQARQIILMAYSDSNKDGGYLTSQWHLYRAQQNLLKVGSDHGIAIQFYHGRGGSIGRGGGPTQRFIQALPKQASQEGLQITEQGEVLSHHYLSSENTFHHWAQYITSWLNEIQSQQHTDNAGIPSTEWVDCMDQLSAQAHQAFIQLKEMNGFIHYFETTTPHEIASIHIGSRPSHRREVKGLDDLRAIPWVFRWYQSRTMLPGWYGLGSAIRSLLIKNPQAKNQLQVMYQQWPFFAGLLNNSATTVLQADTNLMSCYAELGKTDDTQAPLIEAILKQLMNEHALTEKMILEITGEDSLLSSEDTLSMKRSFEMKRLYLDPLNYLQVHLLNQYRHSELTDDERKTVHRSLISSVGGVVAGLGVAG
jgi:phosphoenolpyruvate carboxylase